MSHENDKLDFSKKSSGVVLKDVTKIFQQPDTGKDFVAVDHINLEIKDGEMVTLLGPSGCGKTTTLRMISGFEYPTSGNVFIGERDVAKIPPNKRGISMVFQSYALFPHLNIWENIAYVKKYVKDNMPGVNVIDGEGTYLLWLDFRGTGIDADELDRRIIYDAKLWLDSGKIFGKTGTGFQRINVAAPRKTIEECMERIKKVL